MQPMRLPMWLSILLWAKQCTCNPCVCLCGYQFCFGQNNAHATHAFAYVVINSALGKTMHMQPMRLPMWLSILLWAKQCTCNPCVCLCGYQFCFGQNNAHATHAFAYVVINSALGKTMHMQPMRLPMWLSILLWAKQCTCNPCVCLCGYQFCFGQNNAHATHAFAYVVINSALGKTMHMQPMRLPMWLSILLWAKQCTCNPCVCLCGYQFCFGQNNAHATHAFAYVVINSALGKTMHMQPMRLPMWLSILLWTKQCTCNPCVCLCGYQFCFGQNNAHATHAFAYVVINSALSKTMHMQPMRLPMWLSILLWAKQCTCNPCVCLCGYQFCFGQNNAHATHAFAYVVINSALGKTMHMQPMRLPMWLSILLWAKQCTCNPCVCLCGYQFCFGQNNAHATHAFAYVVINSALGKTMHMQPMRLPMWLSILLWAKQCTCNPCVCLCGYQFCFGQNNAHATHAFAYVVINSALGKTMHMQPMRLPMWLSILLWAKQCTCNPCVCLCGYQFCFGQNNAHATHAFAYVVINSALGKTMHMQPMRLPMWLSILLWAKQCTCNPCVCLCGYQFCFGQNNAHATHAFAYVVINSALGKTMHMQPMRLPMWLSILLWAKQCTCNPCVCLCGYQFCFGQNNAHATHAFAYVVINSALGKTMHMQPMRLPMWLSILLWTKQCTCNPCVCLCGYQFCFGQNNAHATHAFAYVVINSALSKTMHMQPMRLPMWLSILLWAKQCTCNPCVCLCGYQFCFGQNNAHATHAFAYVVINSALGKTMHMQPMRLPMWLSILLWAKQCTCNPCVCLCGYQFCFGQNNAHATHAFAYVVINSALGKTMHMQPMRLPMWLSILLWAKQCTCNPCVCLCGYQFCFGQNNAHATHAFAYVVINSALGKTMHMQPMRLPMWLSILLWAKQCTCNPCVCLCGYQFCFGQNNAHATHAFAYVVINSALGKTMHMQPMRLPMWLSILLWAKQCTCNPCVCKPSRNRTFI